MCRKIRSTRSSTSSRTTRHSKPASGSRWKAGLASKKPTRKSATAWRTSRSNSLPAALSKKPAIWRVFLLPGDDSLLALLARARERIPLVQLVHIGIDPLTLPLQEALDRVGERRVRQPVRGARGHWQEAARHLVFALRAAFERADAFADAELQ